MFVMVFTTFTVITVTTITNNNRSLHMHTNGAATPLAGQLITSKLHPTPLYLKSGNIYIYIFFQKCIVPDQKWS